MRDYIFGGAVIAVSIVMVGFIGSYQVDTRVASQSRDKVVHIAVVPEKGKFVGSGALISPDGVILTCGHLFGRPGKIFVRTSSGQTYRASLVRLDHKVDLAVIKIDPAFPLPYFKLGDNPVIGQRVIAFGSPLAIQGTVSFGWVENIMQDSSQYTIQGAPINAGNSGGPLVDLNGRLVGVNVAVLLLNPFQIAQNLGLSVNMYVIKEFVRN